MEKLKFTFKVEPTTDGKSNYIAITSITTQDDKVFLIPEEYKAVSFHKEIQTLKTFNTVKNSLKKKASNQKRLGKNNGRNTKKLR